MGRRGYYKQVSQVPDKDRSDERLHKIQEMKKIQWLNLVLWIAIILMMIFCFIGNNHYQKVIKGQEAIILEQKQTTNNLFKIIEDLQGSSDTDIGRAIAWIERCRKSHQSHIDNPDWITSQSGDLEFQQECVYNYESVLKVLRYYYAREENHNKD